MQKNIGQMGPAFQKQAEEFERGVTRFGESIERLKVEGLGQLLPMATDLVTRMRELATSTGAREFFAELNTIIETTGRQFRALVATWNAWADRVKPIQDLLGKTPGDVISGARDAEGELRTRLQDRTRTRDQLDRRLRDGDLTGAPRNRIQEQRDKLTEEIEKLRRAIEEQNRGGVQKQSLLDTMFGRATIQQAALGRSGFGGMGFRGGAGLRGGVGGLGGGEGGTGSPQRPLRPSGISNGKSTAP